MKLTILGSGTYRLQVDRATAGYLVRVAGQNLVFDFGRGCINNLLKAGVEYHDIDVIFITHFHADHCNDLGGFFHIALAEPAGKEMRKKDITIYGPTGARESVDHLLKAFHIDENAQGFKVHVKELEFGEAVETDDWSVRCFETVHSDKTACVCYRLESEGKVLAYSGDGSDSEGLRQCCKGADVAILEATGTVKGHLGAEQARKIADESGVKKIILTHFYDSLERQGAEDMMEVDV